MTTFVDAVLNFERGAIDDASRITKMATQALFHDVLRPVAKGGRMRVDTGFLRASARVTLHTPDLSQIKHPDPGGETRYTMDDGAIGLTINRMRSGDTVYMMFTANYARHREYGANGQAPDMFVRFHTNQWQEYVNEAAARVR